ncbi:SDR family oxidoreductase [Flavimaricola marinus]|uniref:2-(R)-hydroxypropyl-CoM dehydrogenase n=1 Tax=Flavimaricola marinus TaxID=1819565 RepID=A0A238LD55_9RHOB|nr:SDR family oxidoreductase [Flavimaricola marinus]SMY06876.1 2-(R)-hydroxypropyl-CoM dehydrogenase [Flavimaricola marinus]
MTLAIVTGASGGLGRALSVALCKRNMPVAGLGRRTDALAETLALAGPLFHPITADVADAASVANGFAKADEIAAVTILINNAAVYPRRDILDETPESFAATMAINLGGVVACTHEALARMVPNGAGRIVNVASMADIAPLPASAAYSVSKGAARVLTKALVADLGDRFPNIVINDWLPGMLATGMGIPDGLDPATAAEWGATLALWDDPSLNGTVWEMDRELPPPRSLKGRIKDKLMLRKSAVARRLS